jgi:thioredoxin 1
MATKTLNETNFQESVKTGITLVDFWAPWCGPCRAFAPAYEKVSEANPDVTFGKVNTEDESSLAEAFSIRAIPTLMAFRDGLLLFQQAGAVPPQGVQRLVDEIKKLDMIKVRAEVQAKRAATAS